MVLYVIAVYLSFFELWPQMPRVRVPSSTPKKRKETG
jgi:hypothetical protein